MRVTNVRTSARPVQTIVLWTKTTWITSAGIPITQQDVVLSAIRRRAERPSFAMPDIKSTALSSRISSIAAVTTTEIVRTSRCSPSSTSAIVCCRKTQATRAAAVRTGTLVAGGGLPRDLCRKICHTGMAYVIVSLTWIPREQKAEKWSPRNALRGARSISANHRSFKKWLSRGPDLCSEDVNDRNTVRIFISLQEVLG